MIELPTPDGSLLHDVAERLGIGRYVDHVAQPLVFDIEAPGTAGLWRARIRGECGQGSAVVKVLRHPSRWPVLAELPPPVQEFFLHTFPWSQEPEVLSEVAACAVAGLRTVDLLGSQWHGPTLRSMWLEDLGEIELFSTAVQFERAARVLGELTVVRARTGSPLSQEFDDGFALAMIARSRVMFADLPTLSAMVPEPAGGAVLLPPELVADLLWIGEHIEALLAMLAGLPQMPVHGDAAPDNLVSDPRDDNGVVLIDLALTPRHAIGFDLGQLVFGRHSPVLTLGEDAVDRVVAAFVAGLTAQGMPVDPSIVWSGFIGSAVIRNASEVAAADSDVPRRIAGAQYLARKCFDLGLVPCRGAL